MTATDSTEAFSEAIGALDIRLGPKLTWFTRRAVFAAEVPGGGQAAVKAALAGGGIDLTRFAIEYLVGSGVRHSNLLRTTGCGVAGGFPFLILEHMPSTVEDLASNGPVGEAQAIQVVLQAARGVGALHRLSLAHGDLKPSNILHNPDTGQVKVCDFGSVVGTGALAQISSLAGRSITAAFASPEQLLNGAPPSPATDVYSLGMALLQLLSGRHPLAGLPVGRVMEAHARGLEWDSSSLSARVTPVIARCLEREPGKRYRSARELARALERIVPREAQAGVAAGGQQSAKMDGPVSLIRPGNQQRAGFEAAAYALSESLRAILEPAHTPGGEPCAVLFHITGVKQDPVRSDWWNTTVVETHSAGSCRSGPRQLKVKASDTQAANRIMRTADDDGNITCDVQER